MLSSYVFGEGKLCVWERIQLVLLPEEFPNWSLIYKRWFLYDMIGGFLSLQVKIQYVEVTWLSSRINLMYQTVYIRLMYNRE